MSKGPIPYPGKVGTRPGCILVKIFETSANFARIWDTPDLSMRELPELDLRSCKDSHGLPTFGYAS